MSIALINTSGRMKAFTLSHEQFCQAAGRCTCSTTSGRAARRLPSSLTLAAGMRLEDVDDAVLALAEVERAIRRGELAVETKAPDAPPLPSARKVSGKARGGT